MQKPLILPAVLAVVCLVASPSVGKAAPPSGKGGHPKVETVTVVRSVPHPRTRITYVIGTEAATGSRIPTVYRAYRGVLTSTSSPAAKAYGDLSPSGAENVSGALYQLDPSITLGGHR